MAYGSRKDDRTMSCASVWATLKQRNKEQKQHETTVSPPKTMSCFAIYHSSASILAHLRIYHDISRYLGQTQKFMSTTIDYPSKIASVTLCPSPKLGQAHDPTSRPVGSLLGFASPAMSLSWPHWSEVGSDCPQDSAYT